MAKKLALVVDDETEIIELLSEVLLAEGYRVHTATHIEQALDLFATETPDIVITDIRMGGGNGDELLRNIRSQTTDVPVVMITGYADFSLEEALNEGAEALLHKPFSLHEFTHLVRRLTLPPELRWNQPTDKIGLTLSVELGQDDTPPETINIARGGMFVAMHNNLPHVLDKVYFKFNFQDGQIPPLEGVGLVRWVRRQGTPGFPCGIGIEFLSLPVGPRMRLLQRVKLREVKAYIPSSLRVAKKVG